MATSDIPSRVTDEISRLALQARRTADQVSGRFENLRWKAGSIGQSRLMLGQDLRDIDNMLNRLQDLRRGIGDLILRS